MSEVNEYDRRNADEESLKIPPEEVRRAIVKVKHERRQCIIASAVIGFLFFPVWIVTVALALGWDEERAIAKAVREIHETESIVASYTGDGDVPIKHHTHPCLIVLGVLVILVVIGALISVFQ